MFIIRLLLSHRSLRWALVGTFGLWRFPRVRLVVLGIVFSAAVSLLPGVTSASERPPQKLIAISDSHMKWASCGRNCVQGIDSRDSISAVVRANVVVLGEVLRYGDSKAILDENSTVLSTTTDGYGGDSALSWVAHEMKVWVDSSAPFQARRRFDGDEFTFGGWAGDGSLALTIEFG